MVTDALRVTRYSGLLDSDLKTIVYLLKTSRFCPSIIWRKDPRSFIFS